MTAIIGRCEHGWIQYAAWVTHASTHGDFAEAADMYALEQVNTIPEEFLREPDCPKCLVGRYKSNMELVDRVLTEEREKRRTA